MDSPRKVSLNKELDVAKKITVYQNGNAHFHGCDTYLNPKHYPNPNIFMDYLTTLIPKKGGRNRGCIRKLFTKSGRRIFGFSQINNGGEIVAAGDEDFKEGISYQGINPYRTPRKNRQSRNNNLDLNYRRTNKYEGVKTRYHETNEPSLRVYMHRNDHPKDRTVQVVLRQERLNDMRYVVEDVNKELSHDCKFPVGYIYTLDGKLVTDPHEFEAEEFYVAVQPNHVYKNCDYSCRRSDMPNFTVNPYYSTTLPRTTYLWQDPNSNSRPTTWTSRHTLPPISKPSPNQSVSSNPEANLRRRKLQQAHEEDVHQKAVKHKRTTPEKKVRQVDYDQDSSNVFKAKNQNKSTKGAKEVKDTRDTKTDLPLDMVKAEEVKEELAPLELNRRPSDEDQDNHKEDISQGKKSSSPAGQQDMNPYKVLDPIKKDTRSSTPIDKTNKEKDEAATKIQASFKGYQVRKELNEKAEAKGTDKDAAPKGKDADPKGKDADPKGKDADPKGKDADPKGKDAAPKGKDADPKGKDADPKGKDADPKGKDAAPKGSPTKEEHEAATKIQASFRGMQTRQELKDKGQKVIPPNESTGDKGGDRRKPTKDEEDQAATVIQAGIRGQQARKQVKKLKDEKKKNEAATLIQANFKGYQVRKDLKEKKGGKTDKSPADTTKKTDQPKSQMTQDEAATKIQASFKGYQTRQDLQEKKEQ